MKTFRIQLPFLLISLCIACNTQKKTDSETANSNLVKAEAPDALVEIEQGYILPGLNHGLLQSPINIVTRELDSGSHEITLRYKTTKEKVANLGHTLQVSYDEGGSILVDGRNFRFKQFHFHTPSEHHIDGITYPMEMHLVHVEENLDNETPRYLVLALLFKDGEENDFIKEFLSLVPHEAGEAVEVNDKYLDISFILDAHDLEGCYHYQGSLTTPPYTESVHWGIIRKIYEASPNQIETINKMEGNNARHIQALYGRKVEQL